MARELSFSYLSVTWKNITRGVDVINISKRKNKNQSVANNNPKISDLFNEPPLRV